MTGYVKFYRQLLDNPIVCKDADHFAIWGYLLLEATHADREYMFRGNRITLKSGQLITGRKRIADKFNISESKVQRVLKTLEIEQMIEQQTSNENRLITVKNWSEYQESEQRNEQRVNNERTTSEQRVNTNKNVKNDKNVVIEDNSAPAREGDVFAGRSFSPQIQNKLTEWLKYKQERREAYKPTGLSAFLSGIENKLKLYSEADVIAVIDESMSNNWKGIAWDKLKSRASPQTKQNNPFFAAAQRIREGDHDQR